MLVNNENSYNFRELLDWVPSFFFQMKDKRKIDDDDEECESCKKIKRVLEVACNKMMVRDWIEEYHNTPGASSSRPPQSAPPETRDHELRISGDLPESIFTHNKLETVNKELLRVQLVDSRSKDLVTSGPLSSIRVKIVPLKGLFGEESWSAGDFRANIAENRQSKGELLAGDLTITLKSGVGLMKNVFFTDTSNRQKFRIGAYGVEEAVSGVKEAVSGAFVVKDRRGESYQKHYPPKSCDDLWRLVRFAKDGIYHNRLTAREVKNVGDFVRMLEADPITLRQILGRIPDKHWNEVAAHARTCEDDKDYYYIFYFESYHLMFDSLYRLQGWRYNHQFTEQLSNFEHVPQDFVNNLKKQAFENKEYFGMVDKFQLFGPPISAAVVPGQARAAAGASKWKEFLVLIKFLIVMKAARTRRALKGKCLRTDSFGMLVFG